MAWLPTGVRIEYQFIIRLLRQLVKDARRLTDCFRVRLDLLSPLPLAGYSLDDAMCQPGQLQYGEKGLFTQAP